MQVMRQRYRLQSHHLDSIFRCDHQQDREQGMCHCTATADQHCTLNIMSVSVWSVFGGLIIDNKYIYMPSLIIKSSLKLKPLSAGPWKKYEMKFSQEMLIRHQLTGVTLLILSAGVGKVLIKQILKLSSFPLCSYFFTQHSVLSRIDGTVITKRMKVWWSTLDVQQRAVAELHKKIQSKAFSNNDSKKYGALHVCTSSSQSKGN